MSHSMKNLLMRTGLISAVIGVASPTALAAVVEGKVTAGGAGVEGAVVEVVETGHSASTDSTGAYRFGALPEGDYTLTVTYIGADGQTAAVTASDSAVTMLNFQLDDTLRVMDSIIVTGQRGSMFAGINQQRAADNVVSVISSDAIGQFPDQNVAESVRRAVGVSVANDQGEGRFVVIRGLDPELNTTSVNGVRLTAPESDTRAVALDVIDSDILDSIEIVKSLTPDLDGDGIGGSINIKTMSAFDRDGLYVKAKADAIYSELSEEYGHKVGLTASNTFGDKFGVAGSLAWNKREFATDNKEGDGFIIEGATVFPEELELRRYEITRERISSSLNFDFRPFENTDLYLRTLYNSFEDQEYRYRTEIKPSDGDDSTLASVDANRIATFTTVDGLDTEIEYDRDIKDRLETQRIWSVQTGGESRFDATTFEYQLAYTHAEEEEPNALESAFDYKINGEDGEIGSIGLDLSDPSLPRFVDVDSATTAAFNDASNYEFEDNELTNGLTEEDELALKFDIKHEAQVLGAPGFHKVGVKTRFRTKKYDVDLYVYEWDGDDDLLLSQFEFTPEYGLESTIGPFGEPGALRSHFFANRDQFELQEIDSAIGKYGSTFKAFEDIYAGYYMAQADYGSALLTGGFRVEATNFTGKGFLVTEFEGDEADAPAGDLVAGDPDEGVYIDYQTARNSYVDFLPSLNARFDVTDNIVARAAYYKSIARPSLKQATPASEIELNEDGEREGAIGNPDLNRQQAHNFDAAIEWYPSSQGVLSAGFFMKSIKDPIATVIQKDYTAFGLFFDEAEVFVNLDDAHVTGLEFNYQQSFEEILPGALGGLILGANYTLIDSQTTYIDEDGNGRSISLPRTSDEIGNVVIGYDKYGLDLRLATSYRSGYIDEIGADGADRFYRARYQVDLTAKYDITDNFQIVGELSNLTDEPEHAVFNTPVGAALSQYDEYGYTAKFGLRYTY